MRVVRWWRTNEHVPPPPHQLEEDPELSEPGNAGGEPDAASSDGASEDEVVDDAERHDADHDDSLDKESPADSPGDGDESEGESSDDASHEGAESGDELSSDDSPGEGEELEDSSSDGSSADTSDDGSSDEASGEEADSEDMSGDSSDEDVAESELSAGGSVGSPALGDGLPDLSPIVGTSSYSSPGLSDHESRSGSGSSAFGEADDDGSSSSSDEGSESDRSFGQDESDALEASDDGFDTDSSDESVDDSCSDSGQDGFDDSETNRESDCEDSDFAYDSDEEQGDSVSLQIDPSFVLSDGFVPVYGLRNRFSTFLDRICEERVRLEPTGSDVWDYEKLVLRKLDNRPLSRCKATVAYDSALLVIDESGSCLWMAGLFLSVAHTALQLGTVEVYSAPDAVLTGRYLLRSGKPFRKSMPPEEMVDMAGDYPRWRVKGRVVVFFGDFDGGPIIVDASKRNAVWWFSCESRYRDIPDHGWWSTTGVSLSDFRGKYIHGIDSEEAFLSELLKLLRRL